MEANIADLETLIARNQRLEEERQKEIEAASKRRESELNIIDAQNKDLATVYNTLLSISRQLDDSLAAIDEASSSMLQTKTGTM
jgi:hypothetical protein